MARRKLEEKNIRKITKTGRDNSYCITLPIEAVRQFGWKERQKIIIKIDRRKKRFIIEDWKSKIKHVTREN